MADEVYPAAAVVVSLLDGLEETVREHIGAFCIAADAGHVGAIADAAQPAAEVSQVPVGAKEARNEQHFLSVAPGYVDAAIDSGGSQREPVDANKRLSPEGESHPLEILLNVISASGHAGYRSLLPVRLRCVNVVPSVADVAGAQGQAMGGRRGTTRGG